MIFAETQYQINWITQNIPQQNTSKLERHFNTLWKRNSKELGAALGMKEAIAIKIIYAISYHHMWSNSDLFKEILIDYLVSNFKLNKKPTNYLLNSMIDLSKSIQSQPALTTQNDKDFLLYILVLTATDPDNKGISYKLGLGNEILTKIKNAAQSIDLLSKHDGNIQFLPEIDKCYSEILLEISENLAEKPWYFESLKMTYLLYSAPKKWHNLLQSNNNSWLFNALISLETQSKNQIKHFHEVVTESFKNINFSQEDILTFLDYLEASHFIYKSKENFSGKKKTITWLLTPLAQNLTAKVFADLFNYTDHDVEAKILKLNMAWQREVILQIPENHKVTVLKLISSDKQLHPSSLIPAINFLKLDVDDQTLVNALTLKARSSLTASIREEACRATTLLSTSDQVISTLSEIAQKDRSDLVKEAANQALSYHYKNAKSTHPLS